MEAMFIVDEFFVLYSQFGCTSDVKNKALDIINKKLNDALGFEGEKVLTINKSAINRKKILSVLFNKKTSSNPFTQNDLEIIKKENKSMCKKCDDWERMLPRPTY
jgi:hypothetical protein